MHIAVYSEKKLEKILPQDVVEFHQHNFTTSLTFYMRFCNGVDENFQHHFVINIGYYCITETCITNSITL